MKLIASFSGDLHYLSKADIRGDIKNVETKIGGIKETDTSEIQSSVSVNKSRIRNLESKVERVIDKIERSSKNPLG